jgi:nitrogen fixation protein
VLLCLGIGVRNTELWGAVAGRLLLDGCWELELGMGARKGRGEKW